MYIHECYLFSYTRQNPLKGFLSQYFCGDEVQRCFSFLYILLVSRPYEDLLQRCQMTVAVSSTGICQKVRLLLHFDNSNIFPQAAGWSGGSLSTVLSNSVIAGVLRCPRLVEAGS